MEFTFDFSILANLQRRQKQMGDRKESFWLIMVGILLLFMVIVKDVKKETQEEMRRGCVAVHGTVK